ncbi:hypothetical protein HK097_002838, partial [Rhizophlyctis rosea]
MGGTSSYHAPLQLYDATTGTLAEGFGEWGWSHDSFTLNWDQATPRLPQAVVDKGGKYAIRMDFSNKNYGGMSWAKPGKTPGVNSGEIHFWFSGPLNFTAKVVNAGLGDASPNCGNKLLTEICTPNANPTAPDTYTKCVLSLADCQEKYGDQTYNRFTLQSSINASYPIWVTDIAITEWTYPAKIMQYLHLIVTYLSFALSLAGTVFSVAYIIYLHMLSRRSTISGASTSTANRRNMMLHFMFAMILLMFSDVASIIFNTHSDGVSTTQAWLNVWGQAAIAAELCAFVVHLYNRIKMQRAFEPITWYPRYLQYILIFISVALPLGVAAYDMYVVVYPVVYNIQKPAWPKQREYALLIAAVWCIALDNCLTIASLLLLFRIRTNLARNSTAASDNSYAVRRSRTVVVTLVLTLILALFLASFCITHWNTHPYVFQITIRIYFWAFLHYLLTLRRIMSAYREIEGKGRLSSVRSNEIDFGRQGSQRGGYEDMDIR